MEIIKVENVEKIYQDNGVPVHALRGIDLAVNKGDYIVIAGPSGSGKTTLLNVMGTLDVPTKGQVFLEGNDVSQKKAKELSEIRLTKLGFVFQAYNLIPVLTSVENIEFAMLLRGISAKERHQKALAVMEELSIAELKDKMPNQMSGGQQQRVAVARAIVNDPVIVLADEPTANLDTQSAFNLLDIMLRLNKEEQITLIFSTHDQRVIDRARRVITLVDGAVASDELFDR